MYDDKKDFEVCGFIKTQTSADLENGTFFVQIKKSLYIKGYNMAKKRCQVEVTFDYFISLGLKRNSNYLPIF